MRGWGIQGGTISCGMTLLASDVGMSVSVWVFVHDVNPSQIIMLYATLSFDLAYEFVQQ